MRPPAAGSLALQWPARNGRAERSGRMHARGQDCSGVAVLLEAAHRAQPCLQPAVISFDAVVGVLLGAVPRRRQQLVEHGGVGRCLVGDHLRGRNRRGVDGAFEEPSRRRHIPPWRDEHVDDLPELVDGAVDVAPPAGDPHVGFVHLPAGADPVAARPGGVGQQRREPLHPPVDGDVVDLDAAFSEQFLDVAVGQAEAQVPADRDDDDVGWEAEAGEGGLRDWSRARAASSHAGSLAARRRSWRTQQRLKGASGIPAGPALGWP